MKKLLLLAFATMMMVGCKNTDANGNIKLGNGFYTPTLSLIDSCEYIFWGYRLAHKGNCKFCAERRKQELKELIEELKDK